MEDDKKFGTEDGISEIEILDLDELAEVSGGRIKLAGYGLLLAAMNQYKRLGKDKEYCLQAIRHGWETDCQFRTQFTDGTDADLEQALAYIDKNWD